MVAPKGVDDLDLDGNWVVGGADDAPRESKSKKGKKRKLQAGDGSDHAQAPSASAESSGTGKKKRKKGGAILDAVLNSEKAPAVGVGADALRQWALTRLETSWAAETKATKLTPLESKDVKPSPSWFVPCAPDVSLGKMPKAVAGKKSKESTFPGVATLRAISAGGTPPAGPAGGVSVLVLCASTNRVFEAKAEIEKAWNVKALALAAHGGGRKKDQVARQAKSLSEGVAVAIATPARLLRLLAEGHVDPKCLGLVVLDLAKDGKQRDVLTLQETRGDIFKLIRKPFLPHLPGQPTATNEGLALLLCGASASSAATSA
eukprot:TRINITY_DN31638_c0_g1_i1.p1 TRINITY_DN31638_c0_g1~~TRINITY_DN31638_c0_g1_i1.p1  ORF type:complete len:318 (+),score=59.72 TRINITY_DN31638_c0_g1_i1:63-1016(+)